MKTIDLVEGPYESHVVVFCVYKDSLYRNHTKLN